eukprot:Gb_05384 [translate_table: standard]
MFGMKEKCSELEMVMNDPPAATELASVLPRVLIVSRRTVRKNKFVDFVGEYHLDLIVNYGAVPAIVPRVSGVQLLLDSFEPIHGVLLCEGEDIDPSLYENEISGLSAEELDEIRRLHSGDTSIDRAKDSIELHLAKRCLERNIPYLGICRGSQVLNVACGGTLYQDVEKELFKKSGVRVEHINYDDYDGHRHSVKVVKATPLHSWFVESWEDGNMDVQVNSYHHQGVKRLAERFKPMAFAPDGLIEAFYDLDAYNPDEGKFIMGLQFHPERMRHDQDAITAQNASESVFDYPGCPCAYKEFVKAVVAYQKKLMSSTEEGKAVKLDVQLEKQRKRIVRSFSLAKIMYEDHTHMQKNNHMVHKDVDEGETFQTNSDLEPGALFLQLSAALTMEQEKRLKQIGATVRNSNSYLEKLKLNKEREESARKLIESLPTQQLSGLLDFYHMMFQIGSEILAKKLAP